MQGDFPEQEILGDENFRNNIIIKYLLKVNGAEFELERFRRRQLHLQLLQSAVI